MRPVYARSSNSSLGDRNFRFCRPFGLLENKLSSVFGEVGRIAVFRQKPSDASTKAGEAVSGTGSKLKGMRGKVEDRIHQYMSSIGRPEFDYDRIRLDFEHILHDPKTSERPPPPPPSGCSVANLPRRFDPPAEGRVFNLRKTRRSDARRELRLGAVF